MQLGSNREGLGFVLEGVNAFLTLACILLPAFAVLTSVVSLPEFLSTVNELLIKFLQSIWFLGLLGLKVVVAVIYRLVVPKNWSLWSVFRLAPHDTLRHPRG